VSDRANSNGQIWPEKNANTQTHQLSLRTLIHSQTLRKAAKQGRLWTYLIELRGSFNFYRWHIDKWLSRLDGSQHSALTRHNLSHITRCLIHEYHNIVIKDIKLKLSQTTLCLKKSSPLYFCDYMQWNTQEKHKWQTDITHLTFLAKRNWNFYNKTISAEYHHKI